MVVTHPKNSCESRAPVSVPRSRCGATSHPHSSYFLSPANTGCRARLGEQGALYLGLPGTDRSLPGMSENCKNRKSLHCTRTTTQVLLYIPARHRTKLCTIPVPTHVLLCDLYWNCCTCTAVYVCRYSAGGERGKARGKNRHTVPVLGWFGVPLLFLFYFICVRYTCLLYTSPSPRD